MIAAITWQEAEAKAGRRLDRRRSYGWDGSELFGTLRYTNSCSGCFEVGDYGSGAENYLWDEKAQCRIGAGCTECGYTGKVRHITWLELRYLEVDPTA